MSKVKFQVSAFMTIINSWQLPDDVKKELAGRRIEVTLYDPDGNPVVLAGNMKITKKGSLTVPVAAKLVVNVDASDRVQDRQISGREFIEATRPSPVSGDIAPGIFDDLEPHRETVPLKKLNTRPEATKCARCSRPLVMPAGMSHDYKYCPKCEP